MSKIKIYSAFASLFLVLYLLFLLLLAPADKLVGQLALPNHIKLGKVSGSLFSGDVDTIYMGSQQLEQVSWSVNVLSLLSFNPSVNVTFGSTALGYQGQFRAEDITADVPTIKALNAQIDADYMAEQLPLMMTVKAAGQVRVNIEVYRPGKAVCSAAKGKVNWLAAQLDATGEYVPLGDLAADLSCTNGNLTVSVSPENNLGLELDAVFNGKRFNANGYVTPGAEFPEQLQSFVGFLGRKDNQGRYRIRI
ncbi:type II secretion system protein N [Thalassotalea maritima]|uniref:type II secretion system protein N n=1 Tax=Thalassotalea maritima TaxID=3242416 RepID=UPI0035272622